MASAAPRREPARVTQARRAGYVVARGELNAGATVAVPLTGCGVLAAVNVVTAHDEVAASALQPLRRVAAQIVASLD